VPALGNRLRQGPTVANPTFQPGGDETVDGFGDMVGEASDINAPAEAYDLMETPTAPAVPVHRIGGRGNDKKEKRARAPRWMVATAIFACLLSVAAIVLELMSDGSSSSGGSTDPHSTQQVGSPVSSADLAALQTRLDAYAANVTLLQQQLSNISGSSELVLTTAPPTPHQVSSSDLAALQTQLDRFITNVTLLQQLVVDQAITIASLQSQLNLSAAPTSQPTTAPTRSPTATPTFVPTTTPTFSPSNAPTFARSVTCAVALAHFIPNTAPNRRSDSDTDLRTLDRRTNCPTNDCPFCYRARPFDCRRSTAAGPPASKRDFPRGRVCGNRA
jgi:hypothetical protein